MKDIKGPVTGRGFPSRSGGAPPARETAPEPLEIARFTVCVTGMKDGTWQGTVEADGERFRFRSEMQLLRWLWKHCPALLPDTSNPGPGGPDNHLSE